MSLIAEPNIFKPESVIDKAVKGYQIGDGSPYLSFEGCWGLCTILVMNPLNMTKFGNIYVSSFLFTLSPVIISDNDDCVLT